VKGLLPQTLADVRLAKLAPSVAARRLFDAWRA